MPHRALVKNVAFEQSTAALSVATGAVSWMGVLQDWLQLVATVIAIVAGSLSVYSYFTRNRKDK